MKLKNINFLITLIRNCKVMKQKLGLQPGQSQPGPSKWPAWECRRFDLDIVKMNDRKLLFAVAVHSASQGKHNGQSYIIAVTTLPQPARSDVLVWSSCWLIILLTVSSHV